MTLRGRPQSNLTNRCHRSPLLTCESTRDLKHTWGQSHWWGQCAFSPFSSLPVASLKLMSNLIKSVVGFSLCKQQNGRETQCHMKWQCLSHLRNHMRSHDVSDVFPEHVGDYGFQEELCWFYEKLNDKVSHFFPSMWCDFLWLLSFASHPFDVHSNVFQPNNVCVILHELTF